MVLRIAWEGHDLGRAIKLELGVAWEGHDLGRAIKLGNVAL